MTRHIHGATRWLPVAILGVVVLLAACGSGTGPSCAVQSVTVAPNPAGISVGETTTLTATIASTNCSTAPAVTWSTTSAAVTVTPNGATADVFGVSPTVGAVAVTATAKGVSGSSQVTVSALPEINLSVATLNFAATEGGANPASQIASITNSGGGSLTGLATGTITYGAGATGWLQAPGLSSTTAPANLTIQPVTGSLTPGTYSATIPVQSPVATNSPQTLTVNFTVTAPPEITLSTASLNFSAAEGGPNPASQFISITNTGGGTLSGLNTGTISYDAGATGWLQAPAFSGTTAPANLTIQPITGTLPPGTYTATIPVQAAAAINTPQTLTVTFTITASPVIGLAPTSLSYSATQGGANPASQFTNISNTGSGTLDGLSVGTITYGPGATGWIQAPVLSGTTAPATLTVQPVTGALAPGTYTATIPVLSGVASNSPQNLAVSFTVVAPPGIALNPTGLSFTASPGGGNPASQFTTISNSGGGTLSGLSVGTITYGPGAAGWLQAPVLSTTTAPATLTIQPVTGALTAGTYTATVPVLSGVASNSPQNLAVTFTVASSQTVATFAGDLQTGLVGFALNVRPAVRVTSLGAPVSGVGVTFAVASGGGSVVGSATINTNGNGVAQVGGWVLGGAPGGNTLTATVAGSGVTGNPVTFSAIGAAAAFNITVQNVGPAFSAPVQTAFNSATAKWQQIIYQDLTDVTVNIPADACGDGSPATNTVVDDVLIFARIDSIDGPNGILGQAGPCLIRSSGRLTVVGAMTFDSADVAGLVTNGSLNAVILHEMGHVLGFGSLWTQAQFNCLQQASSPPGTILDTFFSCGNGRAMFDSIGGTTYTGGNKVPVENCGPASPNGCGGGTVNSHWREPTFVNELMTGFLNNGANPLSRLTAASLLDMGYGVNFAGADAYNHVFTVRAGGGGTQITLGDDLYRGPVYVVDGAGRVVEVIPRR